MRPWSKWLISLAVISAIPLSYFLLPFLCGLFNLPAGIEVLMLPLFPFGLIAVSVFIARQIPNCSIPARAGIGLITLAVVIAATIGAFQVFPCMAKTWMLGFEANFRFTKHPSQVQAWASKVLDQYEAGKLTTSTNVPYWAVGKAVLSDTDIPDNIRNHWWGNPSIGIAAITSDGGYTRDAYGYTNDPSIQITHCVVFSWYENGIVVGKPDFRCPWNPWYLNEIMPGIYAYCGDK